MKTKKWLCRNAYYQAERSTGVAPPPLCLPLNAIPPEQVLRHNRSVRRGSRGQVPFPPLSYPCFVFHSKRKRNFPEPKKEGLIKEPLPGNFQRIFKFHNRTDMGNAKTAEWPDYFDQCLFIRRIKYRYRYVPADKQVPVDELHLSWILEVFPELDHLVGIFRSEFEPKNKQHVLSPH